MILGITSTKKYVFYGYNSDSLTTSSFTENTTDWVHLVYSVDETYIRYIYRNGVEILKDTTKSSFILPPDNEPVNIGWFNKNERDFKGYMDDLRFYDKALTPTEIGYLANNMIKIDPQPIEGTTEYKTLTFRHQLQQPTLLPITGYGSWDNYKEQAESNGGRLPYRDEIIALLNGDTTNNYLINGDNVNEWNDIWIPVNDYIGAFIEIGDYPSHGVYTLKTPTGGQSYYENGVLKTAEISQTSSSIWGQTNPGWIPKDRIYYVSGQTPYTLTFDNPTECDILIVGGGGSGGAYQRSGATYGNISSVGDQIPGANAGGGGAGGLIYLQQVLMEGVYTINVGKGGDSAVLFANNNQTSSLGNNGYNSSISNGATTIEAIGGGGGGTRVDTGDEQPGSGKDGGSGGGTGTWHDRPTGQSVGDGFTGDITLFNGTILQSYRQGYDGGIFVIEGSQEYYSGTGGGGAGESGKPINNGTGTIVDQGRGSDGGNGRQIEITGINTYYAGGGGGTSKYGPTPSGAGTHGSGGFGGGGNAGTTTGGDGADNTGGGGGGVNFNQYTTANTQIKSGSGGSGIVIIRYKTFTSSILYPGTGGKTELPGTAGILALREYRPSEPQYSISRTTGYNLPYSYQWSGITNEHSDNNYLYSIVNSTSFLNTDFIIGFWCYLNNSENISLLSIPDVLKIYISNQTLIFELSDGKATSLIKRNQKWQHLTFVRSNNSLEIYIDNVNKSKLLTKVSVDIVDSSTTLYINKSTTIIDNFIDPIKISDLRIYNNSSKYIIDKLANLPKEQYCYIGANQITDIAPSVLSEFKVNNSSTTALTDTTITYHPVILSSISGGGGTTELNEITINTIVGNETLTAYEWSNLEQSESLNLSNLYMSINNGKDLINKCYTGFEFSTSYWCKFGSSCNIYELQLLSTEHTILELKHNVDNLLELSFDITTDSNQSITTILDQTLVQDHWYLIGITAGISDKYVSLSLGVYDTTFDGSQGSYISSSMLVPLIDNYNYNINNYTNELKINAVEYGDVSYYNRFITLVDIYNILTNNPPNAESLTLTDSTATINLINSSTISTDPISFDMTLDGSIYTLTGIDSLDNSFNTTESTDSSPQTIKIIKGTELTLNITTTTSHPFIIVKSTENPSRTNDDTNKYTTGITYDLTEYETGKGQIGGDIIWDTTNSSLGTYYGICVNHSAMYFKIELVTGIDKTIDTTTNESIIGIDINKYYKMNMSFSFSKNDLELSQDVSDFVIRSESKTYLKFIGKDHPILNLYSDSGTEQVITTTHTSLNSNIWYDYYVTLNYDGTNTTGEIYIGKDKQIDYFTNYTIPDFTPFKDIGLEYDTLEVRIGVNKDEQPLKLNKKIENINIYTKKLNHFTINNLITNNAISIIPSTTIESNKLELWYRLNDFTNDTFNDEIKDSSGKNKNGIATGTNPIQEITTINSKIKSNKLLKNNFKAMKITDNTFNISTPEIILNNNFTIMIKSKLQINADEHNIFTYNDLSVDISNTELKVIYGSTTKTITYTFEEKWYAITLMYNKNKRQLSIYINEELKGKYNSVDITSSTNILKLSDYSSKTPPTNIKLTLEDLRILSNQIKYETVYEYANGINVSV
ncbi:LamG domain-containing protein [bacterium]|nr:LamG domain-containing protein [bacterium]